MKPVHFAKLLQNCCFTWLQAATWLRSKPPWHWWYIGPVVMGNVGDNSVDSYHLHASETQQLADTTPVCYLCGVSRQPMTGRLATQRLRDRFTAPEDNTRGSTLETTFCRLFWYNQLASNVINSIIRWQKHTQQVSAKHYFYSNIRIFKIISSSSLLHNVHRTTNTI